MYWKVTPTHDDGFDQYVFPAETDPDDRHALETAQDVLETKWDELNAGETATVSIQLCKGPIPEAGDEDL